MTLLQAILLGALQGLTEFLPVSSSGHLVMARELLDIREVPILFDILLHIATLAAVVVVFRARIFRILVSLLRFGAPVSEQDRVHRRLFGWLLVASVLTGALGVSFSYLHIGSIPKLVSALFVLTGLILVGSGRWGGEVEYRGVGLKQSLITGICQGFGVFPGISRSGITISAALYSGMNRENAGEFSFLLAIPAILGALLVKLGEADELMSVVTPTELTLGVAVAFVVGLLSLFLLLRIVRQGRLYLFAFYLIPVGVVTFFIV